MPAPADAAASNDPFEEAKRLFLEGVGCLEDGRFEQAEQRFQSSLALQPGRISTLINLAATQLDLSRPLEALACADQVLAKEAGNIDAWFHRGTALELLDRHEEALASFGKVLAIDGELAEPWYRRGQVLQSLKRPEQALVSFDRALAIDPALGRAWSHRGGILQEMKRLDEAAESFRQALAHGADPDLNRYYLAAAGAGRPPAAAPPAYVKTLFDDYADEFDDHLVKVLHYRAPSTLATHLQAIAAQPFRSALDLGCGTGLCGPLLKPMAQRIKGVDLSGRMLEKARARGTYEQLVQAEIVQFLSSTQERHDLVVAADVFIYIGNLEPVFRGVRRVMATPGQGVAHPPISQEALFCFSAEVARPGVQDFELLPSLRYAHAEGYLRELAQAHDFDIVRIVHEPIRKDQREVIDGMFAYLKPR
ncbi:MAG: tetratricopeptide repeat protein [Lautropia sp.]|nr:tetratricopeptide repeat protein [Lautropia sp.]